MTTPETEPPKFNMVWRSLDRALSMPVFDKTEVALMQIARELSYTASVIDGTGRARPFRIFPSKAAACRGLSRERVSRAITALLADNVWTGTRDRARINKNYRKWTGAHALTEVQARECDEALEGPVTAAGESLPLNLKQPSDTAEKRDDIVTPEGAGVTISSQSGVTKSSQVRDEIVTLCGAERDDLVTPHIDEARTVFRVFKTEQRGEGKAPPVAHDSKHNTTSPPPLPTSDGPLTVMPGPHSPTREQVEATWAILWRHFNPDDPVGNERLRNGYWEHQRFYHPDVWMAAIRAAYSRNKRNLETPHYIEAIAGDYEVNGIPETKPRRGKKRDDAEATSGPSPSYHKPAVILPRGPKRSTGE